MSYLTGLCRETKNQLARVAHVFNCPLSVRLKYIVYVYDTKVMDSLPITAQLVSFLCIQLDLVPTAD